MMPHMDMIHSDSTHVQIRPDVIEQMLAMSDEELLRSISTSPEQEEPQWLQGRWSCACRGFYPCIRLAESAQFREHQAMKRGFAGGLFCKLSGGKEHFGPAGTREFLQWELESNGQVLEAEKYVWSPDRRRWIAIDEL